MTDRPWQRGDKIIAHKGTDFELTCWLTRKIKRGGWYVSYTPDLKQEFSWFRLTSLTPADPEPTPKVVAIDPVVDLKNLDHIDLVTQHLCYSLGRAMECLWEADQGDPATSLRELRKAQHHIQVEIVRRGWKETNG